MPASVVRLRARFSCGTTAVTVVTRVAALHDPSGPRRGHGTVKLVFQHPVCAGKRPRLPILAKRSGDRHLRCEVCPVFTPGCEPCLAHGPPGASSGECRDWAWAVRRIPPPTGRAAPRSSVSAPPCPRPRRLAADYRLELPVPGAPWTPRRSSSTTCGTGAPRAGSPGEPAEGGRREARSGTIRATGSRARHGARAYPRTWRPNPALNRPVPTRPPAAASGCSGGTTMPGTCPPRT